jgi:hypothetical protein
VCIACGAIGFLIGWVGGVVEGAQRERAHGASPLPDDSGGEQP